MLIIIYLMMGGMVCGWEVVRNREIIKEIWGEWKLNVMVMIFSDFLFWPGIVWIRIRDKLEEVMRK